MSTAARKARKRAGEKAPLKPVKVVTPLEERAEFGKFVTGVPGTKNAGKTVRRSPLKLQRALKAREFDGGDAA